MRNIVGLVAILGLASGLVGGFAYDQLGSDAGAAPPPPSAQAVREQNLDGSGLIRTHEQGTANVAGTVNVGNLPAVQDVNVVPSGGPVEYTQVLAAWCTYSYGVLCDPGGSNPKNVTADLNALAAQGWHVLNVATSNNSIVWVLERPAP